MKKTSHRHGKKLRVAILKGGPSSEHEVSLKSAAQVKKHLDSAHYDADEVLISKGGEWEISPENLAHAADLAFIALHGTYGEDGTVQSILDAVGMPYTGSDAMSSALAMNKFATGRLFHDAGILTPRTLLITKREFDKDSDGVFRGIRYHLPYPLVIKPNAEGSSVGVYVVHDRDELIPALIGAFALTKEVLAQHFVEGREVTCGVLDQGFAESAFALPPTEIVPAVSHFFDYRAKYEPGGSEEITPARFSEPYLAEIRRTALAAHRLVGARGISRTDFIMGRDGKLYTLEVNTIPGLTEQSLVPKAAAAAGIPFPKLLDIVIGAAIGVPVGSEVVRV